MKHKRIEIETTMDIQPKIASKISTVKNNKEYIDDDKSNISEEVPRQELPVNEIKRCTRFFGHLMKTLTDFKKDAEKNTDEV